MRYRALSAVVVLLLFSLVLGGCSLLQGAGDAVEGVQEIATRQQDAAPEVADATKAAPAPTAAATEAEEEEQVEPVEPEESIDLVDVESLDSYRQFVSWAVTEGDDAEEWSITTEFVRDPAAQRMIWSGTDADGNVSSWEIIQIGTVTYMRTSGEGEEEEWMSMTSDDAEPPTEEVTAFDLDDAESYLSSGDCDNKGRDDIEGQRATHYVCTKDVFGDDLGFWMTGGQLTDGGMEIWVSDEYDVQLASIVWWEGVDEDDVPHAWRMEQKLWDINESFTIEPPEGAAAPGLPEDIALPSGATVTSAMSGMVSFEVEMPMEDAMTFFKEGMPANGWTLESEYEGMLTYTKEGRQAMIMLSEEEAMLSGAIMISEE